MKIFTEFSQIPEMENIPASERKRVWLAFQQYQGAKILGGIAVGIAVSVVFIAFLASGAFLAESLMNSHPHLGWLIIALFICGGCIATLHISFSLARKPFQKFCATQLAIIIREPLPDLEPYPKATNWQISPIRVAQLIGTFKLATVFLSLPLVCVVQLALFNRNLKAMFQIVVGHGWDPRIVLIGFFVLVIGVTGLYVLVISSWMKRTDFVRKTKIKYYLDGKRYSLRWLEVAFVGSFAFVSFVISLVVALFARSYQVSDQLMPDGHGQFIAFRQGYLFALLFLVFSVGLLKGAWDLWYAPEGAIDSPDQ